MEQPELLKFKPPKTVKCKGDEPKEDKVVALRECPVLEKLHPTESTEHAVDYLPTDVTKPEQTEPQPPVRILKIEADGDPWKGLIKPKIRIMGRWLERAGFKPGNRVQVMCLAPGVIELRSSDPLLGNEAKLP